VDLLAIAGLAGLILLKESGVPLPIPGDLVIIGAGATLAGDLPVAGIVLAVILVAGYIGNSIQFFLFSSGLRRPLLAALGKLGISEARLQGLSDRFRSGGVKAVALTRMTPGVRIGVVPAAALAGISYLVFLLGIVAGNGVFVSAHFGLGFLVGAYAKDLMLRYGGIALVVIVVLVVAAVAGWFVLRARRGPTARADSYECWADCSCPACVTIVARAARSATRQASA
jgi:membrane protein DedA with SNARE-associated domain